MADEDLVIGYTEKGGEGTIHYGHTRIDYDDSRDLSEIAGLDEDTTLEDHFGGRVKQPPGDYPDHPPKNNYQRKAVTGNATARDNITSLLDNENIDYTTEDVSPTSAEQDAIEAFGAYNGVSAKDAMKFMRAVDDLDAGNITQKQFQLGKNPNRGEEFRKEPPGRPAGLQ